MNGFTKRTIAALAFCAAAGTSGVAFAEDAPASDFTISGSATIVSEYRFRGVSLSDEDPAAQASIGVSHSSGFYVGVWGSNLAGFGTFGGSNLEIDLYGGWKGKLGGVDLDVGLLNYQYPGTANTDYFEAYGSVSHAFGPLTGKLGLYYAFDNGALADDNTYIYTDWAAGIPDTPITLKAHAGYTDGTFALGENNLWDYSIGADFTYKALTFNVSFVGTDSRSANTQKSISDSKLVFGLTAAF